MDEDHRVVQTEIVISMLLRIGVIASVAIVVLGMVLSFTGKGNYAETSQEFHALVSPEAEFPRSLSATAHGVADMDGPALVVLGLILLIATPVMRVAVSILAFFFQHDLVYVVITSLVLLLLLTSFFLGKVE